MELAFFFIVNEVESPFDLCQPIKIILQPSKQNCLTVWVREAVRNVPTLEVFWGLPLSFFTWLETGQQSWTNLSLDVKPKAKYKIKQTTYLLTPTWYSTSKEGPRRRKSKPVIVNSKDKKKSLILWASNDGFGLPFPLFMDCQQFL